MAPAKQSGRTASAKISSEKLETKHTSSSADSKAAGTTSNWRTTVTRTVIVATIALSVLIAVHLADSGALSSSGRLPPYEGFQPATVALLAKSEEVRNGSAFSTPIELSNALTLLSIDLYEYCRVHEDLVEPSQLLEHVALQSLVDTIRSLRTRVSDLIRSSPDAFRETPVVYWQLLSSLLFTDAVALPDYYQILDDESLQAGSLIAATNTILYVTKSSEAVSLLRTAMQSKTSLLESSSAVSTANLGWKQFVEASLMTVDQLHRRRAALFEMLVVLYPDYAPLRLWYAIGLVVDMRRETDPSTLEFLAREHSVANGMRQAARLGLTLNYAEVLHWLQSLGQLRAVQARPAVVKALEDAASAWTPTKHFSCEALWSRTLTIPADDALWVKKFGATSKPPVASLLLSAADIARISSELELGVMEWPLAAREVLEPLKKSCLFQ